MKIALDVMIGKQYLPRDSILNGLYSLLPLLLDLTADVTKRHTWHLLLISVALFTIAIKLLALAIPSRLW